MDIRSIEIFCKLVENRSFSKTAKDFYVSQPAISKQINMLEQTFNVRLINRTTKSLSLTRAGEIFYENALKVLREVRTLDLIMKNFAGLNFGEITIGASTLPGEYLLPTLIYDFKKNFPEINFNIIIKDSLQIINDVSSGIIEIGIVGSKFNQKDLSFIEFHSDEIIFAGKDDIGQIEIEKLKDLPLITREKGSGTINCVKNFLGQKGFEYDNLNFIAKVGSLNAVKQMILKGIGFSFISKIAIKEELKSNQIQLIPIEGITPIKRNFYIVYSTNFTMSPAVEQLKNILIDKKNIIL